MDRSCLGIDSIQVRIRRFVVCAPLASWQKVSEHQATSSADIDGGAKMPVPQSSIPPPVGNLLWKPEKREEQSQAKLARRMPGPAKGGRSRKPAIM